MPYKATAKTCKVSLQHDSDWRVVREVVPAREMPVVHSMVDNKGEDEPCEDKPVEDVQVEESETLE